MSYIDILRTANSVLLDKAEAALERAERDGPKAIRAAADLAAGDDPLRKIALRISAQAAIVALQKSVDEAREYIEILRELNRLGGDPDRLRKEATLLRSRVASPLEQIHPEVRTNSLRAMTPSAWQDGDARSEYERGFDGQGEAVEKAAEAGRAISRSLESMADEIEAFYLQLSLEIVAFVGSVAGFVASIFALAAEGAGVIGLIASVAGMFAAGGALAWTTSQNRGTPVGDDVTTLRWPAAEFADA